VHCVESRLVETDGRLSRGALVENMSLALESCRSVGVNVVGFKPSQLLDSTHDPPTYVPSVHKTRRAITFVWRAIKTQVRLVAHDLVVLLTLKACLFNQLLQPISVKVFPELLRLLQVDEVRLIIPSGFERLSFASTTTG